MSTTAQRELAARRRRQSVRDAEVREATRDPQLVAWVDYLDVDLEVAQAALRLPAEERGWPPVTFGDPEPRLDPPTRGPHHPLRDPAVVRVPPRGAYARRRAQ